MVSKIYEFLPATFDEYEKWGNKTDAAEALRYAKKLRLPAPTLVKNEDDGYWNVKVETADRYFIASTEFHLELIARKI